MLNFELPGRRKRGRHAEGQCDKDTRDGVRCWGDL